MTLAPLRGDGRTPRWSTTGRPSRNLRSLVAGVRPGDFSKLRRLLAFLRNLGVGRRGSTERVVIFSERIATLRFLEDELGRELGLKDDQLEIFHGSLDDQKQIGLVKSFGTEKSPVRVLLVVARWQSPSRAGRGQGRDAGSGRPSSSTPGAAPHGSGSQAQRIPSQRRS